MDRLDRRNRFLVVKQERLRVVEIERVLQLARRVVLRDEERVHVPERRFDIVALDFGKPHLEENPADFLGEARQRVQRRLRGALGLRPERVALEAPFAPAARLEHLGRHLTQQLLAAQFVERHAPRFVDAQRPRDLLATLENLPPLQQLQPLRVEAIDRLRAVGQLPQQRLIGALGRVVPRGGQHHAVVALLEPGPLLALEPANHDARLVGGERAVGELAGGRGAVLVEPLNRAPLGQPFGRVALPFLVQPDQLGHRLLDFGQLLGAQP